MTGGGRAATIAQVSDEDRLRWAEALAIERLYGEAGPRWIAERTAALALAGDAAGVRRFREIARRYERLLAGRSGSSASP